MLNEGVCELQYRTDLWIIFQVVEAQFGSDPALVTAIMEQFATFATVADFAPTVAAPTGGVYQLPLIVSLRRVFKMRNLIFQISTLENPLLEKQCLKYRTSM